MKSRKTYLALFRLIIFTSLLYGGNLFARSALEARLEIGLNLLPSVIAANTQFNQHDDNKNQLITIYVIYQEDRQLAEEVREKLARIDNIRSHQIKISLIPVEKLLSIKMNKFSVLLIVEPLAEYRDRLIRYSNDNQIQFFSPFKGDVEKGVMAGFEVTNKVLPAVNLTALKAANIRLKAFFLRISVNHD